MTIRFPFSFLEKKHTPSSSSPAENLAVHRVSKASSTAFHTNLEVSEKWKKDSDNSLFSKKLKVGESLTKKNLDLIIPPERQVAESGNQNRSFGDLQDRTDNSFECPVSLDNPLDFTEENSINCFSVSDFVPTIGFLGDLPNATHDLSSEPNVEFLDPSRDSEDVEDLGTSLVQEEQNPISLHKPKEAEANPPAEQNQTSNEYFGFPLNVLDHAIRGINPHKNTIALYGSKESFKRALSARKKDLSPSEPETEPGKFNEKKAKKKCNCPPKLEEFRVSPTEKQNQTIIKCFGFPLDLLDKAIKGTKPEKELLRQYGSAASFDRALFARKVQTLPLQFTKIPTRLRFRNKEMESLPAALKIQAQSIQTKFKKTEKLHHERNPNYLESKRIARRKFRAAHPERESLSTPRVRKFRQALKNRGHSKKAKN